MDDSAQALPALLAHPALLALLALLAHLEDPQVCGTHTFTIVTKSGLDDSYAWIAI